MQIENNTEFNYKELTIEDTDICKDYTDEFLSKLYGNAKKVAKTMIFNWNERVTFLDGKYHISCDGEYWNAPPHKIGTERPKSKWTTRFSGTIEEAQKVLDTYMPVYIDDRTICAYESKKIISGKELSNLLKKYQVGSRVELIKLNNKVVDLEPNIKGTINRIDEFGTLFVNWDNGKHIPLIYGIDKYKKVGKEG